MVSECQIWGIKVEVLCDLRDFKEGKNLSWKSFVKVKVPPCSVAYILGYHKTGNSGFKTLAELKIGGQNGFFFFLLRNATVWYYS